MNNYYDIIEIALEKYLAQKDCGFDNLYPAMRYSLMLEGKRIRPIITLEMCKACGGDIKLALPFACAIEMVHTYSIIHDDLPCMDDDNIRRGKPSNHIVNGEDIALLAGDALLTRAFETMLSKETIESVGATKAAESARILAVAAGVDGMIGGQVMDLKNEGKQIGVDVLAQMHLKKTGALIMASAEIGCILAGANQTIIDSAKEFAKSIGLAFQIVDDILDVTSTDDILGKPTGSDISNKKCTYVSALGLEESKQTVHELTEKALCALEVFNGDTSNLRELALSLALRNK